MTPVVSKEEVIAVRVPKATKKKLMELARLEQRTLSNLVNVMLAESLEDRMKKATAAA